MPDASATAIAAERWRLRIAPPTVAIQRSVSRSSTIGHPIGVVPRHTIVWLVSVMSRR
jgi:hypothetical protein